MHIFLNTFSESARKDIQEYTSIYTMFKKIKFRFGGEKCPFQP